MIKMGQISTTFSKDVMKEMKQHYHDYLKPTPPHALFQAKTTYATITAYKSGKVLFQGKSPQKEAAKWEDRKSTRLNSSHVSISYAVFCLKQKIHQSTNE